MKDLKTLCNVNIPNSLHSLLEGSLLADIEDTIKSGDKYKAVDLEMLMNAKSELEFNMLYDLLKEQIISTQKTPEIVTGAFGHKFVKTDPEEFYIVFYNYKDYNKKESPAIIFGNKNTVSTRWNVNSNKLNTSWSSIDFSNLYSGLFNSEIRILPKKWSKQLEKLTKKSNYR